MKNSKVWTAIIAGGRGTRLFPISHDGCPKQFCQLDKDNTFIQATVRRYEKFVDVKHIVVIVTSEKQKSLAYRQLKWLGVLESNIIITDPSNNFAGCMVIAAEIIAKKATTSLCETIVINTPADHYIVEGEKFAQSIELGIKNAAHYPTIIGVEVGDIPTMTGLGHAIYEKMDPPLAKVESFVEKPTAEIACQMLASGNSVANTGIGIWTVDAILKHVSSSMFKNVGLETNKLMSLLLRQLDVVIANFEWHDCGTLKSLYDISVKTPNHDNATICGDVERINCRGSLFYTPSGIKIVASKVKDTAVIANIVNGRLFIAIVGLNYSQYVKELAKKYDNIKDLFRNDLVIQAENNFVANINMTNEAYVGFIGKNNIVVTIYKQSSGEVIVLLKQTS